MRFLPSVAAGLVAAALAAGAAFAQSSIPAWLDDLERQIAARQQCEIGLYVFVREYELGGREIMEARVQCVDGRQFDAARTEAEVEFVFRECTIRVC